MDRLTGFELLEMAMDEWLDTDTSEELETTLDGLARYTAQTITKLLREERSKPPC